MKVIVRRVGNCNRFDDSGDDFGLNLMILDPTLIIGQNYIQFLFFFGCICVVTFGMFININMLTEFLSKFIKSV